MFKNFSSAEFDKTNQQMDSEIHPESFGKVPKANIALRKGTEKNNVLRNEIRMKKEIDATCNSPISCLKLRFLAISLMTYLLFIH